MATHDPERLDAVDRLVAAGSLHGAPYVIEVLDGLGVEQIGGMRERGHPTQVYLVHGTEWWLYVLNRIAEDPQRLLTTLVDAAATGTV